MSNFLVQICPIQYLTYAYANNHCCLAGIQIELGILCFTWSPPVSRGHAFACLGLTIAFSPGCSYVSIQADSLRGPSSGPPVPLSHTVGQARGQARMTLPLLDPFPDSGAPGSLLIAVGLDLENLEGGFAKR